MLKGKVSGHQRLTQRLQRIRERMPATVSSEQLQDFMVRRVKDRFSKGVDPSGNKWAPLSPATVLDKKHRGRPHPEKPLIATKTLRDAIYAVRSGNAGFQNATGLGFRIGVASHTPADGREPADSYGRWHDQGKGQVQRKFMGMSARDAKALTDLMARAIQKLVRSTA